MTRPPVVDTADAHRLPRFTERLRPLVDAVARIPAGIQRKLFVGFVGGVVLLVSMAIISLVVIAEMNRLENEMNAHARHAQLAQEMLYDVTAQSHYRAMTLLDPKNAHAGNNRTWHQILLDRRTLFGERLEDMQAALVDLGERAPAGETSHLDQVTRANELFQEQSRRVDRLFASGDPEAVSLHVSVEHPASHDVEDAIHRLRFVANSDIYSTRAEFTDVRNLLTWIVVAFSAVALGTALLVGYALSWSIILPVRKMELGLARITAGDFGHHVDVPNRDEFGQLAHDLNRTSTRLALLFSQQKALARRLTDTNLSLVRANQAKSRFLTSVSHELRTPMNAILGFTEALLAGVDGPLNEDQQTSLTWVQRGARDLLGLINQILDLSRIESGKILLDAQPFHPRELVEAVVAQHRSLAAQKGLRLTWRDEGAPSEVVQDHQRVRQILVNLLGNALKFTEEGEVDVVAGSTDNGDLLVSVVDTGPGIPADQHEAIFEEFRTGSRDSAGTGLGLAISRRLAGALGGEVTMDSAPGHGSTFRVAIPARFAADPHPVVVNGGGTATGRADVLLSIDDDPSVAPLLAKMLGQDGYRVVASRNPATAVEDVRRLRPAAVLLDALMPERSGEDVLQELKSDPETADVPVVVVSVVDAGEVPDGADGYVGKPIRREDLLTALDQLRTARAGEQ